MSRLPATYDRPPDSSPSEIVPPPNDRMPLSALEAVTRAELDKQIATAKAYPRNFQRFMATARAMVECDSDLAAACTYVLPKRKGADEDNEGISGPSVRLAEIVAVCWGNLRISARCIEDDGKFLTLQGVAHDLEANVAYSVDLKVGVTYSPRARYNAGARYTDDMIRNATNAGLAKVSRNATFKVVPRAFVNVIQNHADAVATGDIRSLPERIGKALAWFAGKGIPEPRVYAALGVTSREEMTLDSLRTLNGFKTSVAEGHATLAEIFTPPAEALAAPAAPATGPKSQRLAAQLQPDGTSHPAAPPAESVFHAASDTLLRYDGTDPRTGPVDPEKHPDAYLPDPMGPRPSATPDPSPPATAAAPAEPFTEPPRDEPPAPPAPADLAQTVRDLNATPPPFPDKPTFDPATHVPAEGSGVTPDRSAPPAPPFDPTPARNAPRGKGKPAPLAGQKSLLPDGPPPPSHRGPYDPSVKF